MKRDTKPFWEKGIHPITGKKEEPFEDWLNRKENNKKKSLNKSVIEDN
tara:strand:- start:205 stop:348 length:144 start_codon:yes stop_codon:yes gene_type:complete